jgi:hypothetical protein
VVVVSTEEVLCPFLGILPPHTAVQRTTSGHRSQLSDLSRHWVLGPGKISGSDQTGSERAATALSVLLRWPCACFHD